MLNNYGKGTTSSDDIGFSLLGISELAVLWFSSRDLGIVATWSTTSL
jgi:hypothetical protein